MTSLAALDETFLRQAIQLSRQALENQGKTPFGAILVQANEVIGRGTSSVVQLHDPSAHAEVMALRDAGAKLKQHLFETAVLYASSEPCPMCLAACYWARVSRIVFGATVNDVATNGFEDLQFYREIAKPIGQRSLREETGNEQLRREAVSALRAWTSNLEAPVEPKT